MFEIDTQESEGLTRVSLHGELDLSTVGSVEDELHRVEAGTEKRLVIDLSGVSFLDSMGLQLLVQADRRARKSGRRLAIVKARDTVHRVFVITGLGDRFEMIDDVTDLEGPSAGLEC